MADATTPIADGTPFGLLINGKIYGFNLLNDTAGADAMGLVTASPAANTLLGRLKTLADKQDETIAAIGDIPGGGGGGGDASAALQTAGNALLTNIFAAVDTLEALIAATNTALGNAVYYPPTQPVSGTVGITGTVPVSGTFWQATQPVSGNVGITGTVAVTGTFWQATQPISAASLPLPTGASTSAKQDDITTAVNRTASADDIFAITPNDGADLPTIPKALLVTVSGNLAVRGTSGSTVTIPVTAGQIVPLRARRVMTASTATVVGLA